MTPEEIKAAQTQAQLNRLSDFVTLVTRGFTRWVENTDSARAMMNNPLVIAAITSLTDEQLVAMKHAQFEAQWFRDALAASLLMKTFINTKLNPDDPTSPTIQEVFYRVQG